MRPPFQSPNRRAVTIRKCYDAAQPGSDVLGVIIEAFLRTLATMRSDGAVLL